MTHNTRILSVLNIVLYNAYSLRSLYNQFGFVKDSLDSQLKQCENGGDTSCHKKSGIWNAWYLLLLITEGGVQLGILIPHPCLMK